MDKKLAQNVGIAPSSEMATTGVNSVIFALTAIVIWCSQLRVDPPLQRVYMRSMSRASKHSLNLPSDTVFR